METAPDTMVAIVSCVNQQIREFDCQLLATSAPQAVTDLKLGMSAKNCARWRKTFFDA